MACLPEDPKHDPFVQPMPGDLYLAIGQLRASLAAAHQDLQAERSAREAAERRVETARADALEEAARIAEGCGQAMTEKGPWDEGMRDMSVRVAMRLRSVAASTRRALGELPAWRAVR